MFCFCNQFRYLVLPTFALSLNCLRNFNHTFSYLTHPDDVKTLVEGIKFALKLAETKALKRYGVKLDKTPVKGCEKIKFGCDAYWECAVRMQTAPENHQAGSCKMGPRGDESAVVDNLLQVTLSKQFVP